MRRLTVFHEQRYAGHIVVIDLVIGLLVILTFVLTVTAIWQFMARVPFVRTPVHIAQVMIGLVPWKGGETVIDLGAGDGSLLEAIRHAQPGTTVFGREIVPTVWLLGMVRALITRNGIHLRLGSLFNEDLSRADVVFVYLSPSFMKQLKAKFDAELKPGSWVVSHTFGFKGMQPEREVRVPRLGSEVSVYLYRWNDR